MYFYTYISHFTVTSLLSTIICQIGHIINRFITAFVKAPIIFIETQLDGFISFYQTQIFIDIICIICKFTLSNFEAGQTQLRKVLTQTSFVYLKNSLFFFVVELLPLKSKANSESKHFISNTLQAA